MREVDWKQFFLTCARVLEVKPVPKMPREPVEGGSWFTFTEFAALGEQYWSGPLPTEGEILDTHFGHGPNWSSCYAYDSLAHVLVPGRVFWERLPTAFMGPYANGTCEQDIAALSDALDREGIPHRLTRQVLEIRLY